MAEHNVEIRAYQSTRVDGWVVDAPQRQILVDGRFVGYCSLDKTGNVNIVTEVPEEVAAAVQAAVADFWSQSGEGDQAPVEPDAVPVSQLSEVVTPEDDDDGGDELDE